MAESTLLFPALGGIYQALAPAAEALLPTRNSSS
jgi:hypothetical protein